MTHQQKMFTNWQKLVRASEAGEKQADKEQQEIDITQSDKLRTQTFTFVLLKYLIHHWRKMSYFPSIPVSAAVEVILDITWSVPCLVHSWCCLLWLMMMVSPLIPSIMTPILELALVSGHMGLMVWSPHTFTSIGQPFQFVFNTFVFEISPRNSGKKLTKLMLVHIRSDNLTRVPIFLPCIVLMKCKFSCFLLDIFTS